MSNQAKQLARVSQRIEGYIQQFLSELDGPQFHAEDLRRFVAGKEQVAPGSADRILRNMRQRGVVHYKVVDRRASLYELTDPPERDYRKQPEYRTWRTRCRRNNARANRILRELIEAHAPR